MDLAGRVKDYAYKLVAVHVKHDFERQVEVTWKEHFNSLIAYAKTAYREHQRILKAIKEQQEAEARAQAELFMLAFSILAGPAVSWVAGKIEHVLVPKFLGKPGATWSTVGRISRDPAKPGYHLDRDLRVIDMRDHDKAYAKVLGDFGGSLAQTLLVNPAIKAMAPDPSTLEQKLNHLPEAISIEDFELRLNSLLLEAKKYCGTAIVNYAGTILKDSTYGEKWVAQLAKERPSLKGDTPRQEAIEKMLRDVVDHQRREWAKDPKWLYFGHDPKPLSPILTTKALEAELWALWILSEGYTWGVKPKQDEFVKSKPSYRLYNGKSGISLDKVLARLVDLGVVGARSDAERDKIFKMKEAVHRNGKNSGPIAPPAHTRGSKPPSKWDVQVCYPPARTPADDRNDAGLLPMEVVGVEGDVDTEEEFKEVMDWAIKQAVQRPSALRLNLTTMTAPRYIKPIDPANT